MARTSRDVAVAAALVCAASSSTMEPASAGRSASIETPNVVILLADDLGYGDLGCYGGATIATPHIDGMAAGGVRFTSFYAHPVCSPSRAALLTGRYAPRVGIGSPLGAWSPTGLDPAETTIAEVLRDRGYRSALFGKWHLGDSPDQQPTAQGFDEFSGLLWGPTGLPLVSVDTRSGAEEYEPDQRYDTQRVTSDAIEFIDRAHSDALPFFCLVSYTTPHEPAAASPAFSGQSADGRDYGDAVEEMDSSVGAILARLDALGVGDKTLVVMLSDNGAKRGGDPYQRGSNAPLFGGKGSTWEGGVRVPAVACMPGTIPAGVVADGPACITDLLPTIAALAGANVFVDGGPRLDGVDISDVLRGGAGDPTRVVAITHGLEVEAVRRGRLKYRMGALYDVVADPAETSDLSPLLPVAAQELALELDAIRADLVASSREAAPSLRIERRWRSGVGHMSTLADGATWIAETLDRTRWTLQDRDDGAGLDVVDVMGAGNPSLPLAAHRLATAASEVRWILDDVPVGDSDPFTIAFWYRSVVDDPDEDLVLVDIGDKSAGLSVTLGDAGELGDDAAPGRRDDLLVRIGGDTSPTSGTVAVDLPGDTAARFAHVVLTRDTAGDLAVYIDGFELARVAAPGAIWGSSSTWSLFAPHGAVGGSGGPGVLPFAATRSMGELAGFGVWARALRRNEVENQYCRYILFPYCNGGLNTNGTDARLSFSGSFYPEDERLVIHVDDAAPSSVGFLVAGRFQGRSPVANGSLCLSAPVVRLSDHVFGFDADGAAEVLLDWGLAPPAFDVATFPAWNFQCWYRDGGTSNFSNAAVVRFCQ